MISTNVVPSADLALAVTAAPDPLLVGGNLTYTMIVTNNGPSPATNVTIRNTLPTGAVFVDSMHPPGVTVKHLAKRHDEVTASLGTIAAGRAHDRDAGRVHQSTNTAPAGQVSVMVTFGEGSAGS